MLADYIKNDLIFLDLEARDRADLFTQVAEKCQERGYVNDGFLSFLNTREDNYPTGLDLGTYQVAIPHGDPEFVKRPFISLIRLAHGVDMKKMEDSESVISVRLFFILGLTDGGSHVEILRDVIKKLQNETFVAQLLESKTTDDVLSLVRT
ncbi:PTS sugar transporter subunit IIA [Lactovum odontotermitis]